MLVPLTGLPVKLGTGHRDSICPIWEMRIR